jgi:hypothetical protein
MKTNTSWADMSDNEEEEEVKHPTIAWKKPLQFDPKKIDVLVPQTTPNNSPIKSKFINCKWCNKLFEFTQGEQIFFTQKGYIDPKKCKSCKYFGKPPNHKRRKILSV